MRLRTLFLLSSITFITHCSSPAIVPENGLKINRSCRIEPGAYLLNASKDTNSAVIEITGRDITVDFQGATLAGSGEELLPNEFAGLAIRIRNGHNITLKNANIRGYKVAILAENVDSLHLIDCDLSYNYRQKLYSTWETECYSDWLSYHQNEEDEWLRYGAAVYLKNCRHPLVRDVKVTQGQNGIMLVNSHRGWFYNNTIQFNSGIGIGMYRSSDNHIMHNRLDWNVRGHSFGRYARGQDSAGILCYEQSHGNVFAYNSATHSGDGFFLWAGQTTMDSGEGGCNDNLVFANDFSFAPTNGVETTFSRNRIISNRLVGCRYGIWAGYSYESSFEQNLIENCEFGIAIEHGQNNKIHHNYFRNNKVGVQLWARDQQPSGWGYAQKKEVSSHNYSIQANFFQDHQIALKISATAQVNIEKQNRFKNFGQLISTGKTNRNLTFSGNTLNQKKNWNTLAKAKSKNHILDIPQIPRPSIPSKKTAPGLPTPLPGGQLTGLPPHQLQGREYMIINEWGPYNFQYPLVQLRNVDDKNRYTFLLLGPTGNWQLAGGQGFSSVNPKTGTFPATIVATAIPDSQWLNLKLEFIGDTITTQFGRKVAKGQKTDFSFSSFRPGWEWQVDWYNAPGTSTSNNPLTFLDSLRQTPPSYHDQTNDLNYTWWDAPHPNVDPDQFITYAHTQIQTQPGRYRLLITSDDGVFALLDNQPILQHWDIHTPETDEILLDLNGNHDLKIFHFEAGGLSVLQARIEKL